jgi:hypothetical protein
MVSTARFGDNFTLLKFFLLASMYTFVNTEKYYERLRFNNVSNQHGRNILLLMNMKHCSLPRDLAFQTEQQSMWLFQVTSCTAQHRLESDFAGFSHSFRHGLTLLPGLPPMHHGSFDQHRQR